MSSPTPPLIESRLKSPLKKWLTRIALSIALTLLIGASIVAYIAWRATRVPAWYTAALDVQRAPADDAEQRQLIGFRNWLARVTAGNPEQLPETARRYDITLTSEQINALLAKWSDALHNDVEQFRVQLGENQLTLQGMWTARGRSVGITLKSQPADDGRPAVWIDSVRVGEQGVPVSWVNAKPVAKLQSILTDLAAGSREISIDAHGVATPRLTRLYATDAGLSLVKGEKIKPIAFASPQLSIDDMVPVNLIALHSAGDQMTMTFQLLSPAERQALVERVNGIITAAK